MTKDRLNYDLPRTGANVLTGENSSAAFGALYCDLTSVRTQGSTHSLPGPQASVHYVEHIWDAVANGIFVVVVAVQRIANNDTVTSAFINIFSSMAPLDGIAESEKPPAAIARGSRRVPREVHAFQLELQSAARAKETPSYI